ncbi:hypothetical protein ZWY2020_032530 [Hordeum vulgare]|nr:hypothetical protein ZWY2020_032530 [Hordeum vulgare]
MEPTQTLVARYTPPPKTVQLGQGDGSAQPGCGWAFWAVLSLVTGHLAWGLYRARRSAHDLAFVIMAYYPTYFCLWGLYVCLRRHELLRCDDDPAAAPKRRQARFRVWAASLTVGGMIAVQLAGATPDLALKFTLIALGCLAILLAGYCLYAGGRGAPAEAGSRPEKELHEVSTEHRVSTLKLEVHPWK